MRTRFSSLRLSTNRRRRLTSGAWEFTFPDHSFESPEPSSCRRSMTTREGASATRPWRTHLAEFFSCYGGRDRAHRDLVSSDSIGGGQTHQRHEDSSL